MGYGQDQTETKNPFMLLFPFGYDFLHLGKQNLHIPAAGAGFLIGEQDLPFPEVEHRLFGMALYQLFFFQEEPMPGLPKQFHQIDAIVDGRIFRHQLLFIFKSSADRPIAGGISTFQTGLGWGYEVIRRPSVSFILGGAVAVGDFGLTLPSGEVWPVIPVPLIRFGIDTQLFYSSFDFLTGPNFSFTVAPKEKIRFTGDMRMDNYRSITDIICEYILWYRLFGNDHKLGDFAGIGLGFKNDSVDFVLSENSIVFELQQSSVFAVFDLSILKIEGGWVFDSRYLVDGVKTGNPGKGFYVSVQGIIPVTKK
ncbi:MAG: hypothetical protein LBH42_05960 [Treponema sp.]|jgi:hypothetical protein|nr:hypothetical protein [Treponema sp.]